MSRMRRPVAMLAGVVAAGALFGACRRSDTTPPSVPTGVAASPVNCRSVRVTWSPSTDNAGGAGMSGYQVWRVTGAGAPVHVVGLVAAPTTTLVEAGLAPSTAYRYAIAAFDRVNNASGRSVVVTATTPACPPASGAFVRAQRFGGPAIDIGYAIATDPNDGSIAVTGEFLGKDAGFGGALFTSAGSSDVFVAKYTAAGAHLVAPLRGHRRGSRAGHRD